MPIEIRRFGVGQRRPDGPPGTTGVTGQVIHSDARGMISELAFAPNGRIELHSNPNTTWFIAIEGGGWVIVGGERIRIAAGEAALWPPDVPHGAWADRGHMRAFIVEFAGADDAFFRGILDRRLADALGPGGPGEAGGPRRASRGEGTFSGPDHPPPPDPEAGEPH